MTPNERRMVDKLVKDYCVAMEPHLYVPDADCLLMYMDPEFEFRREVIQIQPLEGVFIIRSLQNPNERISRALTSDEMKRITAYWEA